ncbi:MAG TPA: 5'-nucleotidase C-terminal domain-containing protein, partial [Chitinophagaceae bacterium]|nr:5'-nucleotidase C-terminal domain-containing protein [Chitinophagaceae bacterium]
MKRYLQYCLLALTLVGYSCKTTRNIGVVKDDGKIEAVFVLVNDVYEIAPLSGGKEGGMARVATLKKQHQKSNPNTYLVMAGDFLSPSVYNSLQYQGKAIRGKQMVETMNAAGMNLAIFGNHEFDIKESELQDRINESHFQWVASNTLHKQNEKVSPFVNTTTGQAFPITYTMQVRDADGTAAKIGFIGLTLPANRADYVLYKDALATAKDLYNNLKDSVDAVVAITHQLMEDDVQLAKEIPGLAAILGGHEHNMRFKKEGNVYIMKAHSNARSAYVLNMDINKQKHSVQTVPELKYLNESISLDSTTNIVVQKWVDIAEKNYSISGFEARKVVMARGDSLDALEVNVRHHPTNFSRLIVASIAEAAPAEVVLFNSGSIRLDDVLQPPITQYDIIRTLPFGGGIREADIKGSLLTKVLEAGKKNVGIGGYLLYNNELMYDSVADVWKLKNIAIDPAKTYHTAMPDFLLTGKETNLDFLNPA